MAEDKRGKIQEFHRIELREIAESDIPLVETWLNKEYVRQWYNDPEAWLSEIRLRRNEYSFLHHFIVLSDKKPVGFCQYYLCADAGEEEYRMFPQEGTYSIDYLIGEEEYLGKGYGKAIAEELCRLVFSLNDARLILVQPDPENQASCRTLLSAGFIFDTGTKVYIKTSDDNKFTMGRNTPQSDRENNSI